MRSVLIFFAFGLLFSCQQNHVKKETKKPFSDPEKTLKVLLIGTFHFENFNPKNNSDIVQKQVIDVLTDKSQAELDLISQKIADFKPDKIFVEYPFKNQSRLDSVFKAWPQNVDYKAQTRDEIYQIGFRVGKYLNHNRIYAIDVKTSFPYDSLKTQMKKAGQFDLIEKDEKDLESLEETAKKLFNSEKTLSEILFFYNEPEYRRNDIGWYVSLANQGGELNNFVGSHLASEWYKRNLQMYSLVQKRIKKEDSRIMILAGASHIAMFKSFIDYNPDWESIELKEIMSK
ncbi:hypothetical protein HX109_06350 [Galbibacter sp. BG1]|uniref:DUF5694 domain-containing protein n=1 Tax=Galbibacter sp. BG1 TaxID=1170699 RepID=UPI0015C14D64|nr:DUF5694 domain-containing protein [Galbibacter sp. BG1]QLE01203.1 hypothetical protein HX109_06350 [Galbibacter sp. BG1]